jgi:hypothetical protein
LELAFSLKDIGLGNDHFRIGFRNLAAQLSTAASCFELSSLKIVAPWATFRSTNGASAAPVCLWKYRDGSEEKRDVGR